MQRDSILGFSWEFLDEMTVWALVLGCVVAVGGGVVMGSVTFTAGCVIALGIDVALVRTATHRGQRELADGRVDSVAPMVMLAGRLIVKAGLLVLAILVPGALGFAGTVVGALTFDITLLVVGSIVAASRTMRHPKEGR